MDRDEMTTKEARSLRGLQNMRWGAILFCIIIIWTWIGGTNINGGVMFGMLATGIAMWIGTEFSISKLKRKYE